MDNNSYIFDKFSNKNNGNFLEVGYVLTLKDSKNNFKKELEYFSPSKSYYIVTNNNGYKDI